MRHLHKDEYEAVKCCAKNAESCKDKACCKCCYCGNPCWNKFLKAINIVVLLLSLALIGILGYQVQAKGVSNALLNKGLYGGSLLFAILILFISLFGVLGSCLSTKAIKQGKVSCPMVVYYVLLLLLLLIEFIVSFYVFSVMNIVNNAITQNIATIGTGAVDEAIVWAAVASPNDWITVQNSLSCCGYNSTNDPLTATGSLCINATSIVTTCRADILSDLKDKAIIIASIGIVVAILLVVCLIAANCVMCCMKQEILSPEEQKNIEKEAQAKAQIQKQLSLHAEELNYKKSKCRIFLVTTNVITMCLALGLIGIIAWKMNFITNPNVTKEVFAALITFSVFIFIIALFGVIGGERSIHRGTSCILVIYYIFMFVFFLSEIVISVVVLALNGYINNAKVTTYVGIGTSFADSLVIGFAKSQPNAWISTQNILKCCGYANNTQVTSSYATGCYCFVSQSSSCAPVTAIGDPCRSAVLDDAMDQIKIVGAVGFVLIKCFLNSFYISELQLV